MSTLYASFANPANAERAAGALIDQGARPEDISIVANEAYAGARSELMQAEAFHAESAAKSGISVTTPADAAMGAMKGLTVGVAVGFVAALAALTIPGVGLVLGAGALSTALAGVSATAAGGLVAGGVAGYLKDQGLSEEVVANYSKAYAGGGAILGLAIPTGTIDVAQAEGILTKYGAQDVFTYNSTYTMLDREAMPPKEMLVLDQNPNLDPIAISQVSVAPSATPVIVDATTGDVLEPVVATTSTAPSLLSTGGVVTAGHMPMDILKPNWTAAIRPTIVDPVTGDVMEGYVNDPNTGIERLVKIENGQLIYMS